MRAIMDFAAYNNDVQLEAYCQNEFDRITKINMNETS